MRVQSKIDGLFKLKQDLRLPSLVLSQANILNSVTSEIDVKKLQNSTGSCRGSRLRNLSALRNTDSVKYLDAIEVDVELKKKTTSKDFKTMKLTAKGVKKN